MNRYNNLKMKIQALILDLRVIQAGMMRIRFAANYCRWEMIVYTSASENGKDICNFLWQF